jgi:hypothetical protein
MKHQLESLIPAIGSSPEVITYANSIWKKPSVQLAQSAPAFDRLIGFIASFCNVHKLDIVGDMAASWNHIAVDQIGRYTYTIWIGCSAVLVSGFAIDVVEDRLLPIINAGGYL